MARLASQAKMGYYSTPDATQRAIVSRLSLAPGEGVRRLLDPCCGTGQALVNARNALAWRARWQVDIATYGIELDIERAARAADQSAMDRVRQGSIFDAVIDPAGAMGLLWLNPPYDHEHRRRTEMACLARATPWLAPGGVLVFIAPEPVLRVERHLHAIARDYERVTIFRVPRVDYPRFRQAVLFAVRRTTPWDRPDGEMIARWLSTDWPHLDDPIDEAERAAATYAIPATPEPTRFDMTPAVSEADLAADAGAARQAARAMLNAAERVGGGRPLLPLRSGHLVALLTAGMLDGRIAGGRLVLKGYTRRAQTVRIDEETGKEITTDTYAAGIRVLDLEQGRWYDVT